jgi:hypothetical protein
MKSDEIIERWKPVVNYSSKYIEETPEWCRLYVSEKLEEWERKCLKWVKSGKVNDRFLVHFLPQVRVTLGDIKILEDDMVEGDLCMIIENGSLKNYYGILAIPYKRYDYIIYNFVDYKWEPIDTTTSCI